MKPTLRCFSEKTELTIDHSNKRLESNYQVLILKDSHKIDCWLPLITFKDEILYIRKKINPNNNVLFLVKIQILIDFMNQLTKNEQISATIKIFKFVFWENLGHQKDISKLPDL